MSHYSSSGIAHRHLQGEGRGLCNWSALPEPMYRPLEYLILLIYCDIDQRRIISNYFCCIAETTKIRHIISDFLEFKLNELNTKRNDLFI